MRIEVNEGRAILSKKNLLHNIEEIMQFMMESLEGCTREECAVLFEYLGILAEVIAVEEKDETNDYPFLGTSWEKRKLRHGL